MVITLLLGVDALKMRRTFDTSALAAAFPYRTTSASDARCQDHRRQSRYDHLRSGIRNGSCFLGIYPPTLEEWQSAFAESGRSCRAIHPTTSPPNGYLFELQPTHATHRSE
jgi:hypothetical protein